jgi:RNA ligase
MIQHPAATLPFHVLHSSLISRRKAGVVIERAVGPLRLYCYTRQCVYDRMWDEVTLLARGIVLDVERERVVAYAFPKFFNAGERDEPLPDLPFEVFDKLDGSLVIAFHDGVGWRCVTKGSFDSDQARAAQALLAPVSEWLIPGDTHLFEYVAPSNRIVVSYEREELVLLAMYGKDGHEFSYPIVEETANAIGVRCAARHDFASIRDLVEHSAILPATAEGFVIRYTDGTRLKVKGAEYRRIHALVSRCTPLAVWEAMAAGDDLDVWRRELPEELWADFDRIVALLRARVEDLVMLVRSVDDRTRGMTDKELGLTLSTLPEPGRSFIFPYRKSGGDLLSQPRLCAAIFRHVRPTGNAIEGYEPSRSILRFEEESL